MHADRQVDGAQLVHHSPLVRAHVVLARWLEVGGALGVEGLGRPTVQASRNGERGVPLQRRRKGLRDLDLEENLRGGRQQHPAHRQAGRKPGEGPAQALACLQPPLGGRRQGPLVLACPRLRRLPFLRVMTGAKKHWGISKRKSNTHHTHWQNHTLPPIWTGHAMSSPLPTPPSYTTRKLNGIRPPRPPYMTGFPMSTFKEARKDPWGRPSSTEEPSCGPERPTDRLLYVSQPHVPGPDHHQTGNAAC